MGDIQVGCSSAGPPTPPTSNSRRRTSLRRRSCSPRRDERAASTGAVLDIVADPDQVPPADVVVLHRVVCCCPDYAKLLGAVAGHARRQVVFSHPRRDLVFRTIIGAENVPLRLSGNDFRVFAHPPRAMLEALAEHGFDRTTTVPGLGWQVVSVHRS